MSMREPLTTTVSTKGQVILPKAIRRALRWEAGTRLVVESTGESVVLRPARVFAETRPQDVFGVGGLGRPAEVPCGHGGRHSGRSQTAS